MLRASSRETFLSSVGGRWKLFRSSLVWLGGRSGEGERWLRLVEVLREPGLVWDPFRSGSWGAVSVLALGRTLNCKGNESEDAETQDDQQKCSSARI